MQHVFQRHNAVGTAFPVSGRRRRFGAGGYGGGCGSGGMDGAEWFDDGGSSAVLEERVLKWK